ncbi:MAG TPA: hypothetical protein EYP41_02635, partial [Anaerolineae bacterium]|nr:hypothetical protein [Anaerolineae bacterium]
TTTRIPDRPEALAVQKEVFYEQPVMSQFSLAVIESVEEAIYNSLLMAHTVVGRDGNTRVGLPADEVAEIVGNWAIRFLH